MQRSVRALSVLLLIAAPILQAQTCPDGRRMTATLGVGRLQCVTAGICALSPGAASFGIEPSVWDVDPHGPSQSALRDGDVLVAIDGQLITTRAGGALIADLPTARAVTLRIRRNGVDSDVRVTPALRCDRPTLLVMTPRDAQRSGFGATGAASAMRDEIRRQVDKVTPQTSRGVNARIDFGIALECGDCGWRERSGALVFETARPIVIVAVDSGGPAAKAHLAANDVVLEINGIPVTDARAGRALGALRPQQPVVFGIWRRGRLLSVRVIPRGAAASE